LIPKLGAAIMRNVKETDLRRIVAPGRGYIYIYRLRLKVGDIVREPAARVVR
jgi:hypothetical protein